MWIIIIIIIILLAIYNRFSSKIGSAENDLHTVLFISDLGMESSYWKKIQEPITKITKTIIFDLPKNVPKSYAGLINDIHKKVNCNKPIIIIAHSIGCCLAESYANKYNNVAKLILIDPTPDYQFKDLPDIPNVVHYNIINSEYELFIEDTYRITRTSTLIKYNNKTHLSIITEPEQSMLKSIKDDIIQSNGLSVNFCESDFHEFYKKTIPLEDLSIQHKIDEIVSKTTSHGAVLIAHKGNIIYERYINVPCPVFRIHSMTKPVTALSICILIQQKKLTTSMTLEQIGNKYKFSPITQIPNADKITVEMLLQHKSGIYDFVSSLVFTRFPEEEFSKLKIKKAESGDMLIMPDFNEYIRILKKYTEYAKEPNIEFRYNNTGYDILGMIIKVVTGISASEFIKTIIFKNLKSSYTLDFHSTKTLPKNIVPTENLPLEKDKTLGVREQYKDFGANTFILAEPRTYLYFLENYKNMINTKTLKFYQSLYFFKNNTLEHFGAGDFTHGFLKNEKSPPLSMSFVLNNNKFSIIILQNYGYGSNPLIDFHLSKKSKIMEQLGSILNL